LENALQESALQNSLREKNGREAMKRFLASDECRDSIDKFVNSIPMERI